MNKLAELKPRLRLYGDTNEARGYMGAAMSLLHQTLAIAKRAGVPVYKLANTLPDGTQIHAEVYGEQTAVSIITWEYQVQAIESEIEVSQQILILVTIIGGSTTANPSGINRGVYSSFAFDPESMSVVYQDFLLDGDLYQFPDFTAPQNVVSFSNEIIAFPTGKAASFQVDEVSDTVIDRIIAPDLYSVDMTQARPTWRLDGVGLMDKPAGIEVYRWETVRVLHDENGIATSRAIVAASTTASYDREPYRRRVDRVCIIELKNMRVLAVEPVPPFYVLHTSNEHRGSILCVTAGFDSDAGYTTENFNSMNLVLLSTNRLEVTDSITFPADVHSVSPVNACALNDSGAAFVTERPVESVLEKQKPGTQYTAISIDYGPGVFGEVMTGPIANNADDDIDDSRLTVRNRAMPGEPEVIVPWSSDRFKSIDIIQYKQGLFYAKTYANYHGSEYVTKRSNLPVVFGEEPGCAFEIGRIDAQSGRLDASNTFEMVASPAWNALPQYTLNYFWNSPSSIHGEVGKSLQMNIVRKSALSPFNLVASGE